MPIIKLISFICVLFCCTSNCFSQNASSTKNSPFTNQVILSHYTVEELKQLQQTDSLKFKTIVYYYTRSFYCESINCNDCIYTDIKTIDISKYEYLRKNNYNYTKDFSKYGVKLTLIATDKLEYKLPIHLPLPPDTNQDDE
jgi:hypothetical protein